MGIKPPRFGPSTPFYLIGGLWGIGALVHPCPTCVAGSLSFLARGAMEKIAPAKRWMDERFSQGGAD